MPNERKALWEAPESATPNVSLQTLNTLALPATAAWYYKVTDTQTLPHLKRFDGPRFILGGGSNVVLTENIEGLVLHVALSGKQLVSEDSDAWYVQAGAGENWHQFVQWTLQNGFPGLENLALIPGTVGASPVQNIGAYGVEIKDFFHHATAWDFDTRQWLQLDREACRFAYRDSLFKQEGWHLNGQVLVTEVTFRLPKHWQPNIGYDDVSHELDSAGVTTPTPTDIANAVTSIRQRKLPDPSITPNAGSFFQNPVVSAIRAAALAAQFPGLPRYQQADGQVKLAAGWLIEQAGWKGKSLGPVGMYAKQALVLVNHGGATMNDVINTLRAVQEAVFSRFQVMLCPEPVFIPQH